MLVILLTSALTLMFKLMCLVDLPAVGEPSPCVHRPHGIRARVPARMWARPGADVGA
jgi:hypothetical protein